MKLVGVFYIFFWRVVQSLGFAQESPVVCVKKSPVVEFGCAGELGGGRELPEWEFWGYL